MPQAELIIALLAAVALLGALSERVGVPYPPVLVCGGLLAGLIPHLPAVRLQPHLVLYGLLPPLVYAAAFRAASFDLKANVVHIVSLATVLVALTVVAAAATGHAVAALPWAGAFVLGSLAAPTDPVSASAVMEQVGAPERVVAILEGESLINDGTGLAGFQVAVAAAAGGFSFGRGVLELVEISLGGVAIGLACGWLLVVLRARVRDPSLQIVLSLVAAFGSYSAAAALSLSGVLAAVTTGLYAGRRLPAMSSASARLRVEPFWDALSFLLESVLFLLIGLQLPAIVSSMHRGLGSTLIEAVAVLAAVIAVRAGWMGVMAAAAGVAARGAEPAGAGPGAGRLTRALAAGAERLTGRELTLLGWSGMRGALSLAGALSIPLMAAGRPFPHRDQVIFLVYMVVLGTLVVPSLTLGPLIRGLGLAGGGRLARLEAEARARIAHAALARLEELAEEQDLAESTVGRLRAVFELRLDRLERHEGRARGSADGAPDRRLASERLRRELIAAQRRALAQLRAERRMPTRVLSRITHDIDLDETRLTG